MREGWLMELRDRDNIKIIKVDGETEQLADALTKVLTRDKFRSGTAAYGTLPGVVI